MTSFTLASADSVGWTTHPSPVLARGEVDLLRDGVYRSMFAFDAPTDRICFWYSGVRYENAGYVWHTVFHERTRAEVFATIDETSTRGRVPLVGELPPWWKDRDDGDSVTWCLGDSETASGGRSFPRPFTYLVTASPSLRVTVRVSPRSRTRPPDATCS